jgi:N-acetyl-gamma-glutamylphosphate reductase
LAASGDTVFVFVALDNLLKCAAGQAVQDMNLKFGFGERTRLVLPREQSIVWSAC